MAETKFFQDRFDPAEWSALYEGGSEGAPFRFSAELVYRAAVALPEKGILLDAGCGTGQLASRLAGQFSSVIGLDHDPAMLEAARKSWRTHRIHLLNAPVESLPFRDQTISAITAVSLLGCLSSAEPFLRETRRVLKPGGALIFTCTNAQSLLLRINGALKRVLNKPANEGAFHIYDVPGIRESLLQCGFELRSIRTYNFFLNAAGFLFPPEFCLKPMAWVGRFDAARLIGRNFIVMARRMV